MAIPTDLLRQRVRDYTENRREKNRTSKNDSLRFGLGEIQAKITELDSLTAKDVEGLGARIKRRKHATVEDMYRLNHAFLQDIENIRAFAKMPGALQVLVKEFTGNDADRQLGAADCFCNLALGEEPVCEKISNCAGSYIMTYLKGTDIRLKRSCLWIMANIFASGPKPSRLFINMEVIRVLWPLYADVVIGGKDSDFREDAGICLQLIVLQAEDLIRPGDRVYIKERLDAKIPTDVGGEYHLQILMHSEAVEPLDSLSFENIDYLTNYALANAVEAPDFETVPNRMRIVYAVRLLSCLMTFPGMFDLMMSHLDRHFDANLFDLLNKLFSFRDAMLTYEVLWLIKTMKPHMKCSNPNFDAIAFLSQLHIYRDAAMQKYFEADSQYWKEDDIF